MDKTEALEHRVRLLERRIRVLQAALVLFVILSSGYLYLERRRNVFPTLFTDSLTIPHHFWSAPALFNVGSDADTTTLSLGRLGSNEQLRIESGVRGTRFTFFDGHSKKRLSIGISSTGEPFASAYDLSGRPLPFSSLPATTAERP